LLLSYAPRRCQIGTIIAGDPIACSSAPNGSKFLPGMTCFGATISCPNTAPINLTFGYTGPPKPLGTIVLFSGGPGTAPTEDGDEVPVYAGSYVNKYMTVQVEWASAWEDPSADGSGGNILSAACRPATFLNYINSSGSAHPQGAMCAQGASDYDPIVMATAFDHEESMSQEEILLRFKKIIAAI
jgi:hypothetical protein